MTLPNQESHEADRDIDIDVEEPQQYTVILLNDDYTTMEFVIEVLQKFFKKNADEAHAIMLKVHQAGKGVAGIYSLDIAETKAAQVVEYAKAKGHPLKCDIEGVGAGGYR